MGTLPTLQRTWNYDVNNELVVLSDFLDKARVVSFNAKELMVAAGWVVKASSDSSSVKNIGDASPDLWLTKTDIVRATGSASWCVLHHSTLDVSVILSHKTSSDQYLTCQVRRGDVNADGTTSSLPTAAGSGSDYTNMQIHLGQNGGSNRIVMHAQWSSDSKAFRLFAKSNGTDEGRFGMIFEEPSNAPDLWVDPLVYDIYGDHDSNTWPSMAFWYTATRSIKAEINGTGDVEVHCTGECTDGLLKPMCSSPLYAEQQLVTDGGLILQPIGLASNDEGVRGSLGRLTDIWWKPTGPGTGDTLPDDATRTFLVYGEIIFPWDGSVPVIE